MAIKTYVSDKASLDLSFTPKGGKAVAVRFVAGRFSTEDPKVQAHIEKSHLFGKGVGMAPSPLEAARAKAKAAAEAAKVAAEDAEKAAAELKALESEDKKPASEKPQKPEA